VRRVSALLLIVGTILCGCQGLKEESRRVAEAFLDAYYVRIDLDGARQLCGQVALQKIEREIGLTKSVRVDAESGLPQVGYRLRETRRDGPIHRYVYDLLVRPTDMEPFERTVIITVEGRGDVWVVSNYSEGPAASGG